MTTPRKPPKPRPAPKYEIVPWSQSARKRQLEAADPPVDAARKVREALVSVLADRIEAEAPGSVGPSRDAPAEVAAPAPSPAPKRKPSEMAQLPEPDRSGDPRYFRLGLEWIRIGRDDLTSQRQEREAAERRR